mgnify:CR=1 FL=1
MKIPLVTVALAGLLAGASTFASDLNVFPSKGRSDARMDKSKYSCHRWLVKESGYDPVNPPRASETSATPAYQPGRNICSEAESCEEGLPEDANMPRFVIVDVSQQQVTGAWAPGTERVSKISKVQNLTDRLIIQGLDAGGPWSVTVDKETGNVVAVHADRNLGFTIFGACMPK